MYRVRYLHNGEQCYSGTRCLESAKHLVDSGLAEAVVAEGYGDWPQVYPKIEEKTNEHGIA